MKFTIIIPCYNLGNLVARAVESCLNQESISQEQFEVIVINDGSTDNSIEYINQYKHIKNLTIVNKLNSGLSDTRNQGVMMAKGDYIIFLDGDDWLDTKALVSLFPYAEGYDMVEFPMIYYYSEQIKFIQELGLPEGVIYRERFLKLTFGKSNFSVIPAQQRMYRREFLLDNGISFINGILHEDGPFFINVLNSCENLFFLNTPLYYYQQKREGSITSRQTLRNFNGVMAGLDYIEKLPIERNADVRLHNGHVMVYQVTQTYADDREKRVVFKELRTWKNKKRVIKNAITGTFDFKSIIRLLLLFIDPCVLYTVYRLLK